MTSCPRCKNKNPKKALLCKKCGMSLEGDTSAVEMTTIFEKTDEGFGIKSGWGKTTFKEKQKIIFHIKSAKKPLVLNFKSEIKIGRYDKATGYTPELDLTAHAGAEKGVSRLHATIQRQGASLVILDLDSANGSYVNGQRLTARQPHQLRDGDAIILGTLELHIYFG